MAQAPVDWQTARGFQTPRNTQFSVFLANRVGKLHELVEVFDGHDLRIVALSVVEAADHAVVRLVTTDASLARRVLHDNRLPFSEADILVVELGASQRLTQLCMALLWGEVNIYYAYPLMVRPHGAATIALHTDDEVLASSILQRRGFTLLGEKDLEHE